MKSSLKLIAIALSLASTSCDNSSKENDTSQRSDKTKLMIANTKLARDPHTYSEPNIARVTHLEWDAVVDFQNHAIMATAVYDIEVKPEAKRIIFDINGLHISEVKVNGVATGFEIGPNSKYLGEPLVIPIDSSAKKVSIVYRADTAADALLWVDGEKPFLFSQSQAILGRTWMPCQDSPGVRITYNARVKVPAGLLALMSAENPQKKNETGEYTFKMEQPIPSYLLALAVGDIEFRPIGDRTGVYAVPSVIEAAAKEFEDMQKMVEAAEQLYGPYVWGRYDLLVLPAAFPFGGMENPRITFATPTILAGDKSLVALVAHELAHSWSGNLVTNSTWDDFWLNEGFTVYFEQRIMEAVYGRETSEMLATISRNELDATIDQLTKDTMAVDTKLKLSLEGRNPDDGMTDIAYNKGYFFLRLIEETAGREKFDSFIKNYFSGHAFQVMDTERFLTYLRDQLVTPDMDKIVKIDEWVYGEGIPSNAPQVSSARVESVNEFVKKWDSKQQLSTVMDIPWDNWSYEERYLFLSQIQRKDFTAMKEMDNAWAVTKSTNKEVLFKWLENAILAKYTPANDEVEAFLLEVGRRKFVEPLFAAMIQSGQVKMAKEIYAKARPGYHSVTSDTIDALLAGVWKGE
ncbi:MAG: M1 family metallopeptidase [Flavobacteriales bacterium]|nr:M1 family metallopeptidase [Flavobacteriales bacterium]